MVFNTGAALLDAVVLAVVSKEKEGTYGYKITQDVRKAIEVSESTLCVEFWMFRSLLCIRCSGGCRRMIVWRFTIWRMQDVTGVIIS